MKYLKLPPELSDDVTPAIQRVDDPCIAELIAIWTDEATVGESVTLELVEMTEKDFDALPDQDALPDL